MAKWTDAEIQIIRDYYPEEGTAIAERLPERKLNQIIAKASALGVKVLRRAGRGGRILQSGRSYTHAYGHLVVKSAEDPDRPMVMIDGEAVPARSYPEKKNWNQAANLERLPWLKMPTTPEACAEIEQWCGFVFEANADEPVHPEAMAFFSSLKAHIGALAERFRKRAA